jgi:NAD(P)-dependent dehydrogenase (short-subunit alcohol dehydrogenase family)
MTNPSEINQRGKQWVLVTGASKGIGRATALELDRQGYYVFGGIRNLADGESLKQAASSRLQPVQLDVTDQAQVKAAAREISQMVGSDGLAGLINNAGVAVGAPLEFIPLDELRRQLEINVVGQVAVTQAMLPLVRQACGRIINVSSIGGRISGPNIGAYHASKFALEAITDTLRIELKPWGIEVISIQPGGVRTPIWETSITMANQLFARMPPQFDVLYPQMRETAKRIAENGNNKGMMPEQVAAVIIQALTTARPKTRYLVGSDAKFVGNFVLRLPDRIRDRLVVRQLG